MIHASAGKKLRSPVKEYLFPTLSYFRVTIEKIFEIISTNPN
jgi:hypothetical protein